MQKCIIKLGICLCCRETKNCLRKEDSASDAIRGWSGGAMVPGKLPVPGRPTILVTVGQGPIALAVGAGGDGLDLSHSHLSFLFFLPLFGRRPDID